MRCWPSSASHGMGSYPFDSLCFAAVDLDVDYHLLQEAYLEVTYHLIVSES